MNRLQIILSLAAAAAAGCAGPTGEQGPPGPLSEAPRIAQLLPTWGSTSTRVHISGANFSATPTENRVTFDGMEAVVLSASATDLVVQAGVAVDSPRDVAVSVEVARQVSNAASFQLVPSGFARTAGLPLIGAPAAAVAANGALYVASGEAAQQASGVFNTAPAWRGTGLFRVAADGTITRVLEAHPVTISLGGQTMTLDDGPFALATDGTDVWFTTSLGGVRRYQTASGTVTDVLSPRLGNLNGLTGIARDSAGNLYVVDQTLDVNRGGVLLISPAGELTPIIDGTLHGGYGIATEGADVYVTIPLAGTVMKIANAANFPLINISTLATGGVTPRAMAIAGGSVYVSNPGGPLQSVPLATGGVLSPVFDPAGYLYEASGLAIDPNGALLLAQAQGGVVRRIAQGQEAAEIVAAGVRPAFATLRAFGKWYLAEAGTALFAGSGPPQSHPNAPDSVMLEVADDASSRIVARGQLLGGMALDGTTLVGTDCVGQRIFRLELPSVKRVDLLTEADGLLCPAGLVLDQGNFYFTNITIPVSGPASSEIARHTTAGNDLHFITGLAGPAVYLAKEGSTLLTGSLGMGSEAYPIYSGPMATGGPAEELVPASAVGGLGGLGVSPLGGVFVQRLGTGEILSLDPASGTLGHFGSAIADSGPALAISLGFGEDGTIVTADVMQGGLVQVAP